MTRFAASAMLFVCLFVDVARAEEACECLSITAAVTGAAKVKAELGDSLYAAGDFAGALRAYAEGHAQAPDPSFLYAQAMVHVRMGGDAQAKAMFEKYLKAPGELRFRARAEGRLRRLGGVVGGAAGAVAGVGGALGGAVTGAADTGADVAGPTESVSGAVGGVTGRVDEEVKPAKTAAYVVGGVAVVGVLVLGGYAIYAQQDADVDFDPKFGVSTGVGALSLGAAAFYMAGITAAAAPGAAVRCAKVDRVIAPVAYRDGAGVAAAFSF